MISGSSGGGGDDLIATLMAQANVAVSDNVVPAPEETKSDSKEEDEAAKKEAKRLERNAKAKAARDAKKAAAAAAAANAEAPTPVEQAAVAKAPAPVVQATVSVENDAEFKEIFQEPAVVPTKSVELSQSPVVSDSESEEEDDATSVRKFEFQGKTYLKDDDGCLYDLETQEHIGNFDDVNQCIDYCDEDEE